METIEEIQDRIDDILAESDENVVELLSYASSLERLSFFAKLRELIREKDSMNDQTATAVLGWAYERLAE